MYNSLLAAYMAALVPLCIASQPEVYGKPNFFDTVRSRVKDNPDGLVDDVLNSLVLFNLMSPKTVPTLKAAAQPYVQDDDAKKGASALLDKIEGWLSEEDIRAFQAALDDITVYVEDGVFNEKVKELAQSKAESITAILVAKMRGYGSTESFFDMLSTYFIQAYDFVQSTLDDTMRLTIVNSLLMSKDFPPINKFDQIKSISALLQRCVALFTTYTPEEMPVQSLAEDWIKEFEINYFTLSAFQTKLSSERRREVMAKAMMDTFSEPLFDLNDLYSHFVNTDADCRLLALCLFNENYAFAISSERQNEVVHSNRVNRIQAKTVDLLSQGMVVGICRAVGMSEEQTDLMIQAAKDGQRGPPHISCRHIYGGSDGKKECFLPSTEKRVPVDHHSEL